MHVSVCATECQRLQSAHRLAALDQADLHSVNLLWLSSSLN